MLHKGANTTLQACGILDQWCSTWGTRTPGGKRRHLRGVRKIKKKDKIIIS